MNAERFRRLLEELIDENPFAIRAALKILDVCFTESVPTLAVTCEERPRLLVNLEFVCKHCRSDAQVKAVICHELQVHQEARALFAGDGERRNAFGEAHVEDLERRADRERVLVDQLLEQAAESLGVHA